MPFTQITMPQYRDADEDGLIGLRGVTRYCQDIHTWYMHSVNKGNDVLPEQYGAGWIYTRYRVQVCHKMDYTDQLSLRTWMEPYRQPVLVNINVEITQHDRIAATGKLETCLFSLTRQRPLRLSAVEFPENFAEDLPNTIPDFSRLEKTADGMESRYIRTVRTSDLDKNRHMNNLRYVEMFQDAHDSAFWDAFQAKELEICFLSQSREGEALSVRSIVGDKSVRLAALHEDGTLASVAEFRR